MIGLAICIVEAVALYMGVEFDSDSVIIPLLLGGISMATGISYPMWTWLATSIQAADLQVIM
ncbi:MAG: hypothetical protein K2O24_04475 [Muribaculaceae bacterium]|nr:hypothetical protein [Muribaculaceae bacterium]